MNATLGKTLKILNFYDVVQSIFFTPLVIKGVLVGGK